MEVMDLNAYRYKTVLNSNWSHMLLFEKFPDYMHVYLLVINEYSRTGVFHKSLIMGKVT